MDGCWPELRLALELDSWEYLGDRLSFREDRIRDRRLSRAGIRVIRVTDFDLGEGLRRSPPTCEA